MKRFSQRLTLETLEDRRLLATCHVVRLGDFGAGADLGGGQSRGDLRYCINKANDGPGPDVIDLSLTGTIDVTSELPQMASDLDIQGPGSALLTVRRSGGADFRIFTVIGDSVSISGLTVAGGRTSHGGGINNHGNLTLNDVVVTSSTSIYGQGGGIYNAGNLIMTACTVSDNTAGDGQLASVAVGGGILNSGSLVLENSTIATNLAVSQKTAFGGGIYNTEGAQLTVASSTILGNRSQATTSGGNPITVAGGGIYNSAGATMSVENTMLHGNAAYSGWVGGNTKFGFGGGIFSEGPATIQNSTIFGNAVSLLTSFIYGGGIYHAGSTMEIVNSTIANNVLTGGGFFFDSFGGGIYSAAGLLRIGHSTIASNGIQGGMSGTVKNGGGIAIGGGAVHLHDTIAADNFLDGGGTHEGPDLWGALASSSYNLFDQSAGGSGYAPTDILDVDPMLGSLQDNAGPTWTVALLPGSPAIDAGDPNPEDPPEWDQRGPGFPRIVNGRLDIGAFEVQATGAPLFDGLAVLVTADLDADEGMRG